MKSPLKPIRAFKYNPPLRVISNREDTESSEFGSEEFLFARPKLKRQIAHDRVSRYFQRSGYLR